MAATSTWAGIGGRSPRAIRRVLVANRGEIAVRIVRTCRALGLETVAVYSEADAGALHTQMADEAVAIGPAPAPQSYLNIDALLEAARSARADAVHPGYGFLAENSEFAARCEAAGLVFIGPPAEAIAAMADKVRARQIMQAAGVPVVPGSDRPVASVEEVQRLGELLGYPLLLKATAGGGGRGMRVVRTASEVEKAVVQASAEAARAFGDGSLYVERFFGEGARHVEVQVLADHEGRVQLLFERECSVQRRHQKLVEEAPSPAVTPGLRRQMGEVSVAATEAVGYRGAGTLEFLLDADGRFYFLEMNTRIQVEHPVTEWTTGRDLIADTIRVAAGLPLPPPPAELRGHAIECRIYAENPKMDFFPSPGRISYLREPGGPWVRVDSGVVQGSDVPLFYDPLIAKLSVWGADRGEAIGRMRQALAEYEVSGVHTTIPFLRWMMHEPEFLAGTYDTGYVARHLKAAQASYS